MIKGCEDCGSVIHEGLGGNDHYCEECIENPENQ